MSVTAPDRLQALLGQNNLTGIDFVYVHKNQRTLDVYFLKAPDKLSPPIDSVNPDQVFIRRVSSGMGARDVELVGAPEWRDPNVQPVTTLEQGSVLRLFTSEPGGFEDHVFNDCPPTKQWISLLQRFPFQL